MSEKTQRVVLKCKQCTKKRIYKLRSGGLVTCHSFCEDYKKWKIQRRNEIRADMEKKKLDKASYSLSEDMANCHHIKNMEKPKRRGERK